MPSTGRGGAGNIQSIPAEQARHSVDLETADSDQKGPLPSDGIDRDEQQYAHSGRGGAGNYYSPKELSQTGQFYEAGKSHVLGEGTAPPTSSTSGMSGRGGSKSAEPTRTYGRGGAGNFSFGVSESEERAARKRMEDDQKREKLQIDIEKGVQENLAMPQKAKLPGSEPF